MHPSTTVDSLLAVKSEDQVHPPLDLPQVVVISDINEDASSQSSNSSASSTTSRLGETVDSLVVPVASGSTPITESDASFPLPISPDNQLKRNFGNSASMRLTLLATSPTELPCSKRQKMISLQVDSQLLSVIDDPATPISPANTATDDEDSVHGQDEIDALDDDLARQTWPLPSDEMSEWLNTFSKWSHVERIQALDELVTQRCEMKQLRHLMEIVEPQLKRDFISLLPKELSLYVLSLLDPKDLLSASQTSRYWRVLCEDNLLWREKCREEQLLDENQTLAHFFKSRLCSASSASRSAPSSFIASSSGESSGTSYPAGPSTSTATPACYYPSTVPVHPQFHGVFQHSEYKTAFLRQKNIEHNWRNGVISTGSDVSAITATSSSCGQKRLRRLRNMMQLKGHDDHVITCLQFNPESNLIVSGSDDNTLKVWSSESGSCLRTLTGHTGGVWSSQLSDDNLIISGSTDRTLKVWDALSGQCLHTLYGHTSTVRCMALHGHEVVSGSRDATLRLWDIITGECKHVLVGHMAAVRCVQYNGKLVVSGAYDYQVKVWDPKTETCLHTLEGHTNRVYSLQFDGEHIVSGSLDTSIRVWSASSGTLKSCLIGHQSLTSGMQLRGNILVSGNADSTVKVWDINVGTCLQTLAGPNKHQSAVTCLQFNNRFVITSSDDGTVKLWDLRTGQFVRNLVSLTSGERGGVVWRIRASNTKLVAAVGSRNGTEETKLLVLDFDVPDETDKLVTTALEDSTLVNPPLSQKLNLLQPRIVHSTQGSTPSSSSSAPIFTTSKSPSTSASTSKSNK